MRNIWNNFWAWYERNYLLNVGIAVGLFLLQLLHLVWLSGDVVLHRLIHERAFEFHGLLETILILVDYTEIPAILSVSLIYIHALQKGFAWQPLLLLIFLNSQWLHIFWITDEFVVNSFNEEGTVLPSWLAWVAILIDYLEVPVMVETTWRFLKELQKRFA